MDTPLRSPASHPLFFAQRWPSFLETYARSHGDSQTGLRLPADIWAARYQNQDGIAIGLESESERRIAQTLFRAVAVPPQNLDKRLTAEDLLTRLPWWLTPAAPEGGTSYDRLLVQRTDTSVADLASWVERLLSVLYGANGRWARDLVVSAAISAAAAPTCFVFISGASGTGLSAWLRAQDPAEPLRVYRGYEPRSDVHLGDQPYGIWTPLRSSGKRGLELPYVGVLADGVRRLRPAVRLAEPENDGRETRLTVLEIPFQRIYHYTTFTLSGAPGRVEQAKLEGLRARPFQVRLDLRPDPDFHPRREATLARLVDAEARIQRRQRDLKRESGYLSYLRRRAEAELLRGAQDPARNPFEHRPRKSLYLFFESHSATLMLGRRWAALQEVILTASLAELRNLRYARCGFGWSDVRTQRRTNVVCHLVGGLGPESREDGSLPPGLLDADLIFDQDPDWRDLGFSLYLPRGFSLSPPLRPASPGHFRPHDADALATPEDNWPGAEEDQQLFADLMAQAVFAPEADTIEPDPILSLLAGFRDSNQLCLLYRDPLQGVPVPVFLRPDEWRVLEQVPAAELNQLGLGEPVRDALARLDQDVAATFRREAADLVVSGVADEIIDGWARRVLNLLDESLTHREEDLRQQRLDREEQVRLKTDEIERDLEALWADWDSTRQQLEDLQVSVRGTPLERLTGAVGGVLGAAAHIQNQLRQRTKAVEEIAERSANHWLDFIQRLIQVTETVTLDTQKPIGRATDDILAIDQRLQRSQHDVIAALQPRLAQLDGLVDDIRTRVQGETQVLTEFGVHVAQAERLLAGQPASTPSPVSLPAPPAVPDLRQTVAALQLENQQLRQDLDERESGLQQQLDAQEREARELRRRAALVDVLQTQVQRASRDASDRESRLQKDLGEQSTALAEARREVSRTRQQLDELRRDLDRLTRKLADTESQAGQHIQQLQAQMVTQTAQIREFAALGVSLSVDDVRARFNRLAAVVDELRHAEVVSAPEVAAGLALLREKFVQHLESEYPGARRIAIQVGETMFDPRAGHHAFGMASHPDAPDGAILTVLGDGFRYHNQVIREAQVIVNQLPEAPHEP